MGIYGLTNKKVLTHPLKFIDIYYDIAAELPQHPNLKLVEIELNKVIRMINDTLGLWRELTKVSTGTITTNIENATTWDNNIESTILLWDQSGRFNMDWDWDSTEKRLTMSDNVVELMGIYVDDEEWEYKSYEEVKDSSNSSDKYITKQADMYTFLLI